MSRRFALLAVAWIIPLMGALPTVAQDAADCASALWLDPLSAPEETEESAIAEITEPAPAWMTIELTDACTGQTFRLSDFAGKTLYVESMATWCPPCRDQLSRVNEAMAQLAADDREDVVFVALSSEVDLPREALAAGCTLWSCPTPLCCANAGS